MVALCVLQAPAQPQDPGTLREMLARAHALDSFARLAPTQTVVRCRRDAAWSCDEASAEEAARTTKIILSRTGDGHYDPPGLERLLRAFVDR